MVGYEIEIRNLRTRVQELERQVEHLRVSRRVLMNLLEKTEKDKRTGLTKLEKENKRLQLDNQKYAQSLMRYNCRFVEMERHQSMEE